MLSFVQQNHRTLEMDAVGRRQVTYKGVTNGPYIVSVGVILIQFLGREDSFRTFEAL